MFNLSVVNIIPDTYHKAINQIAELYGCGENNLSVKLQDSDGDLFWGCHGWWKPEDYAYFSDEDARAAFLANNCTHEQIVIFNQSLDYLYERLVLDGNAQENWKSALSDCGLTLVESSIE